MLLAEGSATDHDTGHVRQPVIEELWCVTVRLQQRRMCAARPPGNAHSTPPRESQRGAGRITQTAWHRVGSPKPRRAASKKLGIFEIPVYVRNGCVLLDSPGDGSRAQQLWNAVQKARGRRLLMVLDGGIPRIVDERGAAFGDQSETKRIGTRHVFPELGQVPKNANRHLRPLAPEAYVDWVLTALEKYSAADLDTLDAEERTCEASGAEPALEDLRRQAATRRLPRMTPKQKAFIDKWIECGCQLEVAMQKQNVTEHYARQAIQKFERLGEHAAMESARAQPRSVRPKYRLRPTDAVTLSPTDPDDDEPIPPGTNPHEETPGTEEAPRMASHDSDSARATSGGAAERCGGCTLPALGRSREPVPRSSRRSDCG